MRALLTPEVAPMSGVVLFRPGNELLWLFRRGRVVIETPSEAIQHLPSGLIPEAHQPLTDDVSMQELFLLLFQLILLLSDISCHLSPQTANLKMLPGGLIETPLFGNIHPVFFCHFHRTDNGLCI